MFLLVVKVIVTIKSIIASKKLITTFTIASKMEFIVKIKNFFIIIYDGVIRVKFM
jgi:hypothetical protein